MTTPVKLHKFTGPLGQAMDSVQRTLNEVIRGTKSSGRTRMLLGPWINAGLLASSTVPGELDATTSVRSEFMAHRPGSIVGITFSLSDVITAGSGEVQITRNGDVIHTGKLDTDAATKWSDQHYRAVLPPEKLKFSEGDTLQTQITTDGSWFPTTLDCSCWLEILI